MPENDGVIVHKSDKCDDGYRLYSSRMTETAHLIEPDGTEVHQWTYDQGFTWHYAEMLPNGHLLAIIKEVENSVPGMAIELDWDSHLVWHADVAAHHDLARLANGNTLIVCREYIENKKIREGTIKSDSILEVNPAGQVTWEWHLDEHVDEIADLVPVTLPSEPYDWAHTNTVESLPSSFTGEKDERFRAGNLLISPRNLDSIAVVDRDSERIIWAWGPGELEKQHMPTMLENGNILIFDNGTDREATRIIELDPLAEEIVWQYSASPPSDFYSPTRGANERLPNGNTFITDSDSGRLFEVTPAGEIVWEFLNPDRTEKGRRMPLYRALRYEPALVMPLLNHQRS
ncbi:MAG: arylsulfotransferase family protein [Candidatus Brocadiia bacterium]